MLNLSKVVDSAKLNDWLQAVGLLRVIGSPIFVGPHMKEEKNNQ